MNEFGDAVRLALGLVGRLDPELLDIVGLSLRVSLSASLLAFLIGAPLGALLAVYPVPGRQALLILVNALLGLPPVVVGLVVYLLISRAGPLGALGLLFTPGGMILAQTMLAAPIVVALVHRLCEGLWAEYGDLLLSDGASRLRALATLFAIGRAGLVTAFLAEVGAILIVGGNIRGHTRTMTTAIALETSRGDLALALALGLILIATAVFVTALTFALGRRAGAA